MLFNNILPPPATDSSSSSSSSRTVYAKLEWRVAKNKPLPGTYYNGIRPDFVLTCCGIPLEWRSVLVVGKHQSTGSTVRESFTRLATYAEQVFLAQPFRICVSGVLTSNRGPNLTFWRFDRSGAIGSVPLNYSTSNLDLLTVVSALGSIPYMNAHNMGFHVDSISWGGENAYPLDHESNITIKCFKPLAGNSCVTVDPSSEVAVSLQELVFLAPGIATRGTRVWRGIYPPPTIGLCVLTGRGQVHYQVVKPLQSNTAGETPCVPPKGISTILLHKKE